MSRLAHAAKSCSFSIAFRALSVDTPLVVHQQAAPSAPGGDAISNDYEVRIPSDTYTVTLDYDVTPAEITTPE